MGRTTWDSVSVTIGRSTIASITASIAVRSFPRTIAMTAGPPKRASARTTPGNRRMAWHAARGPGLVVDTNTYASTVKVVEASPGPISREAT